MIFSVLIFQLTFQRISSIIQNWVEEDIIYWGQNYYFFGRSGHFSYNTGNCRHNPSAENKPFPGNFKIMACFPPVLVSLIPFFCNQSISENAMLCSFLNCFYNLWCSLKIHICNPHGEFALFHIPFHASCSTAVYRLVKYIFWHCVILLYFSKFPVYSFIIILQP